jgi:hypothetical protein
LPYNKIEAENIASAETRYKIQIFPMITKNVKLIFEDRTVNSNNELVTDMPLSKAISFMLIAKTKASLIMKCQTKSSTAL